MQLYPAALTKILLPATLICGAYLGRAYVDQLGSDSRIILDNLPYLLCLIAALMAYQFNRCRLLLASFGVAAFYWTVQKYLQVSLFQPSAWQAYLAMSFTMRLRSVTMRLVRTMATFSPLGPPCWSVWSGW